MLFNKYVLTALASLVASAAAQSKFDYGTANPNAAGVVSQNANGPTNPKSPSLGTAINQTSLSRLASVNSVDDWCTFSSPNGEMIADSESFTVAYCTKARNNARVIPDGTLTAVHFVKTPLYVQVMALGDFTKIGMQSGDQGGELDPHGAEGLGNPVGGNVTSNVTGTDVFYEEWMNYISYQQVCIRVCIAGSSAAPTALECQHTLDEMGCNFVMPGNYADNSFDTCDADAAYPPGLYPEGNGQTSTFQQYYSSVYTASGGAVYTFVNGSPDQTTPSAAYSLPATSNCVTTSTIANGIASLVTSSSSSAAATLSTTKSSSAAANTASSGSSSGSSSSSSSAASGASSFASGLSVAVLATVGALAMAAALL